MARQYLKPKFLYHVPWDRKYYVNGYSTWRELVNSSYVAIGSPSASKGWCHLLRTGFTDGQVLCSRIGASGSFNLFGIIARGPADLSGNIQFGMPYAGYAARAESGATGWYLYKCPDTVLGSASGAGVDSRMRLQCVGTAIKAKFWLYTDTEPDSWTIEVTDSAYTSGTVAMGGYVPQNTENYIYGIGIDFGGTDAPTAGGLKTITGQVRFGSVAKSGVTVIAHRQGAALTAPLIPGIDVVSAVTDANGNFTLTLDTDDTGDYTIEAHYTSGGVKYAGAVVANAGASGLVIEMRPAYVTRARIKATWYSEVWDKVTGVWVKRT